MYLVKEVDEIIKAKDTIFNEIPGISNPITSGSSIEVYDWHQIRFEDVIDISIDLPWSDGRGSRRLIVKPGEIKDINQDKILVIHMYLKGYRHAWHINDKKRKKPQGAYMNRY